MAMRLGRKEVIGTGEASENEFRNYIKIKKSYIFYAK